MPVESKSSHPPPPPIVEGKREEGINTTVSSSSSGPGVNNNTNPKKIIGILLLLSLIVVLVFLPSLGSLLLGLVVGVVFLFLGATCRLYLDQQEDGDKGSRSSSSSPPWIKYETKESSSGNKGQPPPPRGKLDMRISGSAIIDEIIHEMIDYIVRDYVHSWYDYVSDDDEFIRELRAAIQEALVHLSSRVKEVDWTPYLTTQLVDDAATHVRLYRTALAKVKENSNCDLLSVFFDLEAGMEKGSLCRDMVCIDDSHLNDYFQGLADSVLYLLLPADTYACNPVGILAQDLLVQYVLIPVLNLFSEPDFVNQYIIWLCQGFPASSDTFLSVIRTSDNIDEMLATREFFAELQAELKSSCERATSSDELSSLKSQIKCINVIRKCVDSRLTMLKEGGANSDWTDDGDGEGWQNYFLTPGIKLHSLSLHQILNNSVASSYFLDFMNGVGGGNYLLMYLNLTAWKGMAETQFAAMEKQSSKEQAENSAPMMDCLKTAATNVFNEFIPENAKHRVRLPESVMKRFFIQMQTSSVNPSLFDDIYECLVETMESNEKYYQAFLKSKHYIKCLMDLDLLRTDANSTSTSDDEEDELNSIEEYDVVPDRSNVHSEDYQTCLDCLKVRKQEEGGLSREDVLLWEQGYLQRKYFLRAEIIEAGLTTEKGKQFGVYAIQVTRTELWDGRERRWHIYRRYSDFYDFHQWIKTKWMRLSKMDFPSKHTFRSTDRGFLERRMGALNKYLDTLMEMTNDPCYGESMRDAILHFLEPGSYIMKRKMLSDKIETVLVNPLKLSVKTVTNVVKNAPDSIIGTFDLLGKTFFPKSAEGPGEQSEAIKVGASIDVEVDDNIPLRISLLLMDEVFDLKERNQWLRRRIVAFCREIFKAMYGDTINRRIVDHVAFLTNPIKVSGYLRSLQRSLWPDGQPINSRPPRDSETKMRTRVAAKSSFFALISDDLKRLIGSETTRRGLLSVFDMLQNRILNRRFTIVLFEGILKTLFPDKPIMSTIQRLHFRSNRVGKNRPFLMNLGGTISSHLKAPASSNPQNLAGLSPRGTRRKKS